MTGTDSSLAALVARSRWERRRADGAENTTWAKHLPTEVAQAVRPSKGAAWGDLGNIVRRAATREAQEWIDAITAAGAVVIELPEEDSAAIADGVFEATVGPVEVEVNPNTGVFIGIPGVVCFRSPGHAELAAMWLLAASRIATDYKERKGRARG